MSPSTAWDMSAFDEKTTEAEPSTATVPETKKWDMSAFDEKPLQTQESPTKPTEPNKWDLSAFSEKDLQPPHSSTMQSFEQRNFGVRPDAMAGLRTQQPAPTTPEEADLRSFLDRKPSASLPSGTMLDELNKTPAGAAVTGAGEAAYRAGLNVVSGAATAGRGLLQAVTYPFMRVEQLADYLRDKMGKPKLPESTVTAWNKELDKPTPIELEAAKENEKALTTAMQSTGIGGAAATDISSQILQTVPVMIANLKAIPLKIAGEAKAAAPFIKVWLDGIKEAIPNAAKFAGLTYAQTPGDEATRLKSAAHSAVFMIAPAVTAGIPVPWLAKTAATLANMAINTPSYLASVDRAKELAKQQGGDWKTWWAISVAPTVLSDVLFGTQSHSLPKQRIKAEWEQHLADAQKRITPIPEQQQVPAEAAPQVQPEQPLSPAESVSVIGPTVEPQGKPSEPTKAETTPGMAGETIAKPLTFTEKLAKVKADREFKQKLREKKVDQQTAEGMTTEGIRKDLTGRKLMGDLDGLISELEEANTRASTGTTGLGRKETGEFYNQGKAYPEGFSKPDIAILKKFRDGKPLNMNQADTVQRARNLLIDRLSRDIPKTVLPSDTFRTGEKVDIDSEQYTAKVNPDGSVTLKDGTTKTVKPGESIAVDEGSYTMVEEQPEPLKLESVSKEQLESEKQKLAQKKLIEEMQAKKIAGKSVDTTGDMFDQEKAQAPLFSAPTPKSAIANQPERVQLKSQGPRVFEIVERKPQTEIEKANDEQIVTFRDAKTGETFDGEIKDIARTVSNQPKPKSISTLTKRATLDAELKQRGLDPDSLPTNKDKVAAIKRHDAMLPTRKGPGAAAAVPEAVSEKDPEFWQGTGIKNAYTKSMQERLGLEPTVTSEAVPEAQAMSEAGKILESNPHAALELIDRFKAKPFVPTQVENMLLLHETITAEKLVNDVAEASHGLTDPKALAENAVRMESAMQRLQDIYAMDKHSGTQAGRAFRARQRMADEDYNLVRMIIRKRLATGGQPLNPEQKAEVQRTYDKLEAYKRKIVKKTEEIAAKTAAGDFTKAPQNKLVLDKEAYALKEAYEKAKQEWNEGLKRDKLDAAKWIETMDAYLAERKITLPDALHRQIEADFKQANRIVNVKAREAELARVVNRVADYVPLRAGDWFYAYVYNNMLSSPMSHGRNILGNFTNQTFTRPMSLLFQRDFKGAATYFTNSWKTLFNGDAWKAALDAYHTGETSKWMEGFDKPEGSAFDTAKRIKGPQNVPARKLWHGITAVTRFLQAQDVFFGKMIETGETARLLEKGESFDTAKARATALSNKYLYRDKLKESPDKSLDLVSKTLEFLGSWMDKARNTPWGYVNVPMRMAIPFLRTPVKIAQFNTEMTPLGFIGAKRNRIAKAHYEGVSFDEMQRQLSAEKGKSSPDVGLINKLESQIDEINTTSKERMGRAAVGTMFTVAGFIAAASGNTIWAAPKDPEAKRLFYDAGYKPYSVRIGNKWIPMMYFGPAMIAFAMPAAIKDVVHDNPESSHADILEKSYKLMLAIPQMLVSQLPLQGLSSLLGQMQGREDYTWKQTVGKTGLQLVLESGLLRWIKNFVDPTYRKPVTIIDTIEANIPGLSQHVKAIKDARGLDAKASLWDAISPYKVGTVDESMQKTYQGRMNFLQRAAARRKAKHAL